MPIENEGSSQVSEEKFQYTNRLIREKSPYLLLHAHNPVDWYPWGEDAFAKARREHKPIFLSIGYYTCHWCHVMERESFSDPSIAEILNRDFVPIKVDREERPDLDRIYIAYVEATTGGAGWPLSVFLTPDVKPFFGGTYYPPEDAYGRPGFRTLLERIAQAWNADRLGVMDTAEQATKMLARIVNAPAGDSAAPDAAALDRAYSQIRAGYDARYGGFGGAPKFPRPVVLNFLLRYYSHRGEKAALEMTLATLRAMAAGGIHDHLGGGFHRYSTDAHWHVPHFEKMLYDQAQLAAGYVEAWQMTREPFYAETARDILDFVLREMRSPEGGFYSALDADSLLEAGKSEQGEGAFYVWRAGEIERALGRQDAAVFDFVYGVAPDGNAAQDPQGEFAGKNILYLAHSEAEAAQKFAKPEAEIRAVLARAREKLFAAREHRPRPPVDDKIVTSWNGLMISAFARAGAAFDEPRYLEAARAAADFIQTRLMDRASGHLRHRFRAGEAAIDGVLDDYAFLIQGLLDLYEADFDWHSLESAARLQEIQDELFWDKQDGGYFSTTGADPSVLVRTREAYDGAEPAPSSIAALNLLRLAEITGRKAWGDKARRTIAVFAQRLEAMPESLPQMAVALDFSLSKPAQIVIAGRPGAADTQALLRLVHQRFLPNKVLLLADGGDGQKLLASWLPFVEGMAPLNGKATAYVCENYVCKLPSSDPEVVARLLEGKSGKS